MKQFIIPLLNWYAQNREPYFFRADRNPYKVWVSEVALQQTRINAALPLLQKFLQRFPSLEVLTRATEGEVLTAWTGLGYYNRARNLHRGARYLLEHYGGAFPKRVDELLKVPSIGPYTAAAIASICFGTPVLAIDGNVKRVLARWFFWQDEISSSEFQSNLSKTEPLLLATPNDPGELNEALMEFGQKICTPRPQCEKCFLQQQCLAFRKGRAKELPLRRRATEREELHWKVYLVYQKGQLLLQQNGTNFPFLKNMPILPSEVYYLQRGAVVHSFPENFLITSENAAAGCIRHAIMHYQITVTAVWAQLNERELPTGFEFVPVEYIRQCMNSSLMQKIMQQAFQANELFLPPG